LLRARPRVSARAILAKPENHLRGLFQLQEDSLGRRRRWIAGFGPRARPQVGCSGLLPPRYSAEHRAPEPIPSVVLHTRIPRFRERLRVGTNLDASKQKFGLQTIPRAGAKLDCAENIRVQDVQAQWCGGRIKSGAVGGPGFSAKAAISTVRFV